MVFFCAKISKKKQKRTWISCLHEVHIMEIY